MEKINVAELLKDCPKGMELDCYLFNGLEFDHIDTDNENYPIVCRTKTLTGEYNIHSFTKYGWFTAFFDYAKCVIFPKGETTWEGFVPPYQFKDGDVLSYQCIGLRNRTIYIYRHHPTMNTSYYVALGGDLDSSFYVNCKEGCALNGYNTTARLATEEEKQKLFDAIKENGYKWNPETKTLEKLGKLKFKVGDRIRHKENGNILKIVEIDMSDSTYCCGLDYIWVADQDKYELVPDRFDITALKPFDKVLVRNKSNEVWTANFYSHYDATSDKPFICVGWSEMNEYRYCIPYDVNNELLGTTNNTE